MERAFLVLVALNFVGVGGYNLLFPAQGMAGFELSLGSPSSLNEIRANYGGMHLLLGLFFLSGALRAEARRSALLLAAIFTGGLVGGRIVSLVLDGSPNGFVWRLLALEAAGCAAAFALWRRSRPRALAAP
jgi:hypothetical protein